MKYLLAVVLSGVLCGGLLVGFWRVHVRDLAEDPALMAARISALTASWDAQGLPVERRVLTLVISDAYAGPDLFAVPDRPTSLSDLVRWLRRAFGPKPSENQAGELFARAFIDDPGAVVWVHEGFATASESELVGAVADALTKARDARATVAVVTQGASAAPALQAIERSGVPIGKMISAGASSSAIAARAPLHFAGFKKPKNLGEWVSAAYTPGGAATVEVLSGDAWPVSYDASVFIPPWDPANPAPVFRSLLASTGGMARTLAGWAQRARVPEAPSRPGVAHEKPQDSLSMVKGGADYAERPLLPAPPPQPAAPRAPETQTPPRPPVKKRNRLHLDIVLPGGG